VTSGRSNSRSAALGHEGWHSEACGLPFVRGIAWLAGAGAQALAEADCSSAAPVLVPAVADSDFLVRRGSPAVATSQADLVAARCGAFSRFVRWPAWRRWETARVGLDAQAAKVPGLGWVWRWLTASTSVGAGRLGGRSSSEATGTLSGPVGGNIDGTWLVTRGWQHPWFTPTRAISGSLTCGAGFQGRWAEEPLQVVTPAAVGLSTMLRRFSGFCSCCIACVVWTGNCPGRLRVASPSL